MGDLRVGVIGAGPAGLTAAYMLAREGVPVTVFESDAAYVGGIARTVEYKGFRFDIGGHRFFSKSQEIEDLWSEILPDDMLERSRLSRIYFRRKFFTYPLSGREVIWRLGLWESALCTLSYVKAHLFPVRNPKFGERLFRMFFQTYTEKVWGMRCSEISADWAAQRMAGFSLVEAIKNVLLPTFNNQKVAKTLIRSFRYPRLGPGMMWEACARKVREWGGEIRMGQRVASCELRTDPHRWILTSQDRNGTSSVVEVSDVISTTAISDLSRMLKPSFSESTAAAARGLRYRDFLTTALILREREKLDDNWIYVHDPGVRVGRIQIFKNWSPEMVPDPALTCYGLEYFCSEGDDIWSKSDEEMKDIASRELEQIGLARREDVVDACTVRQPKAYPVYDDEYARAVKAVREEVAARYPRLHMVGRNGMHKYNNQDHSMMTAMLTARNIIAGELLHDVWQVNQDAVYHEKGAPASNNGASGLRATPTRVVT